MANLAYYLFLLRFVIYSIQYHSVIVIYLIGHSIQPRAFLEVASQSSPTEYHLIPSTV